MKSIINDRTPESLSKNEGARTHFRGGWDFLNEMRQGERPLNDMSEFMIVRGA